MATERDKKKTIKANNEPRDIEIREHRDRLATIGTGVMVFGIWNVVKTVGLYLISTSPAMAGSMTVGGASPYALAMLPLSLGMRCYVGISAMSVSRGIEKSGLYIFFARLMLLGSILVLAMMGVVIMYLLSGEAPQSLTDQLTLRPALTSTVIEITSMILVAEMIHSAKKLRKLQKDGAN